MNEKQTPPPEAIDPSLNAEEGVDDAPPGPDGPEEASISFEQLGLGAPVLQALADMGFTAAMKVQAETLPLILAGRDLMVQSRTGSGKTAAFGIPLIDRIVRPEDRFVQAIVLMPTRELALQVAGEVTRIAAHSQLGVVPIYGGAPMGRQIEQLHAGGQIVCGTPGRVLDHLRRGTLKLDRVRCAILDECDEMLSMGFQEDIEAILEETPTSRQTLLFSATMPEGIQRLGRRFLRNPEFLKLSADFVGVHEIRHVYYAIPGGNREAELLRVLAFENPEKAIVFCNTREETGRVAEFLRRQGFEAEAISSDLTQADREKVMSRMRAGGIRFLVATDVAARGIDLEALSHVINYTFPESPEVYIHRTGRTGRAGRHGTAISLIGPTEVGAFYYVKLLYKIRPEERSLPSEAEIRSKREGERIQSLRDRFAEEPVASWRSLARRVMTAIDGEKLIASLLADALADHAKPAPARPPVRSMLADSEDERPAGRPRDGDRPRGDRPDRGRGRWDRDRPEREARPDRERRPLREDRPPREARGEREARPEREPRPEGEPRPERERGRGRDARRGPNARRGPSAMGGLRGSPATASTVSPEPSRGRASARIGRPGPKPGAKHGGASRRASRRASRGPSPERRVAAKGSSGRSGARTGRHPTAPAPKRHPPSLRRGPPRRPSRRRVRRACS